MIPIAQIVSHKGTAFDAKTWRVMSKVAWRAGAEDWHEETLPKHFTAKGTREYRYKPRAKSYMKRKASQKKHQNPLVWSGESKKLAEASYKLRASSKGARLVLSLPKHFYQYRKDLKQPNKARELQAITQQDAEQMAGVLDGTMQDQINNSPDNEHRV